MRRTYSSSNVAAMLSPLSRLTRRRTVEISVALFFVVVLMGFAYRSLDDTVTFFILGDFGVDDEDPIFAENLVDAKDVSKALLTVAKSKGWPRATFLTGDLAYPHGVQAANDTRLKRVFERIPLSVRSRVPFYATPGNHDCEGDIDAWATIRDESGLWRAPLNGGATFGENTFNLPWGGVLRLLTLETCTIVCSAIDGKTPAIANHRCDEQMKKYVGSTSFGKRKLEQVRWMETIKPKQPGEWLVVIGHWPVYSFRGNGPTREMSDIVKWMRSLRVDAHFSGHDHALQHINGGNPSDPEFFVSGAGGYPLHKALKSNADADFNKENHARLVHVQELPGFMTMELTQNRMRIAFMDSRGSETYRATVRRKQ